jgi:DNA-binding response OmpR family regulator
VKRGNVRLRRTPQRLRKILVIDDDEKLLASYRDLLTPYGFEILIACDGQAAMPLVDQNPDLSLVILDLMMPKMDGNEWLQWYRAQRTDSPVIIISGYDYDGSKDTQPSAVLRKPFHVAELLDLVGLFCGLSTAGTAAHVV